MFIHARLLSCGLASCFSAWLLAGLSLSASLPVSVSLLPAWFSDHESPQVYLFLCAPHPVPDILRPPPSSEDLVPPSQPQLSPPALSSPSSAPSLCLPLLASGFSARQAPSVQSIRALAPGVGGRGLCRLHCPSLSRAGPRGAALSTAEAPSQTSNQWEQAGGEEGSRTEVMGEGGRRRRWKEGEAAQGEGGGEIGGRREGRVE